MIEDEGTIIAEMLTLTSLLGGKMERNDVTTSDGRSYKKIIIEYGEDDEDE
tara:strand:+ start:2486 stop:2638 length:153 start_codon:yes stop_codon:yes gene_type:complete